MDLSDEMMSKAIAAGQMARESGPVAHSARLDLERARLHVTLMSGVEVSFPLSQIEGLQTASLQDLDPIEISPSGLGLYIPRLDVDLFLPALMQGIFGTQAFMAKAMGQKGGSARSEAKASASRENGKRGGRPKKVA